MIRKQTIPLLLLIFVVSIISTSCGKKVVEEIKLKHTDEETTEETDVNSTHSNDPVDTNSADINKQEETDSVSSSGKKEISFGTIKSTHASDYVGKNVIVKGYVADVHITKKVAYLNFDNKYPNNTFTGVIFARSFPVFDDIDKYEGKTIEISGEVTEYKGKPQIILENKDQIKISN